MYGQTYDELVEKVLRQLPKQSLETGSPGRAAQDKMDREAQKQLVKGFQNQRQKLELRYLPDKSCVF